MADGEVSKSVLHDWIESETRALDVVASWETLCDVYRTLEFTDPISDTAKLEEFKWIIRQMNAHLSRARKKLMSCQDTQSVREILMEMFNPKGDVTLACRTDLAYQKLRQIWVTNMLMQLEMMEAEALETMLEAQANGVENGW